MPSARTSPASHMNFLIGDDPGRSPGLGTKTQEAALEALQTVFPEEGRRRAVRGLLGSGTAGGGSFHCITQQEPR